MLAPGSGGKPSLLPWGQCSQEIRGTGWQPSQPQSGLQSRHSSLTTVPTCPLSLGFSCSHRAQLLGRDDNDPNPQSHGFSFVAAQGCGEQLQHPKTQRRCRQHRRHGTASARDRLGRAVETNLRQQVQVTHGKGCQHTGTGPSRRGGTAGDPHSAPPLLPQQPLPEVMGELRGGKWLRKRRKIQWHRDLLVGRNLPVWGHQPGGVTPAPLRVEGRGS